ncbi:hypothetical protein IGI04_014875 [Brassica rapa subsp. trilocularis]|uniref:Uncharacterized protein n=1 Tax=Brassica rapa subsp. trilocularis TaxID=1813537 RepID=A0ABQ7MNF5_BRACM|nr:hypothetical protein IGI04_014875 [Brassica rapa subsp. trilocularis]
MFRVLSDIHLDLGSVRMIPITRNTTKQDPFGIYVVFGSVRIHFYRIGFGSGMQSLHLEDAVGEQVRQHNAKRTKDDDDSYEVTLDEDFLTALEYVMPPPASRMAGDAVDKLCEYKRRHCVSCSESLAVIIVPNVSSGIKPNIRTFNILIDSYGKRGNYKKMSAVMKFVDLGTYNVVIDAFERGDLKQMEIPI